MTDWTFLFTFLLSVSSTDLLIKPALAGGYWPCYSYPRLHADGRRVTTGQFNLMDNAPKHSSPGVAISIKALRNRDEPGIQGNDARFGRYPADLFRIFQKSRYLALRSGVSGMGLGLPLTRRIATLPEERINVFSLTGQDSTFTLWPPLFPW